MSIFTHGYCSYFHQTNVHIDTWRYFRIFLTCVRMDTWHTAKLFFLQVSRLPRGRWHVVSSYRCAYSHMGHCRNLYFTRVTIYTWHTVRMFMLHFFKIDSWNFVDNSLYPCSYWHVVRGRNFCLTPVGSDMSRSNKVLCETCPLWYAALCTNFLLTRVRMDS